MSSTQRYELLEKIGTGSFATVYRARDNELGREIAVKEIHAQYREDPKLLERYWHEAQLLASLQHPNIVTIFDVDRDQGWLIMELMQTSLSERLGGRQIDLRALRTTIAHTLRALKYLHERGIIHGDIKPSNLMIDARKRVKLGDFGLARRASDDEGSLLKGTTKYMAPELVSTDFGEVSPASDLYSVGFAAYELMCGADNFEDLFPGLGAHGRDQQAAWIMWHAAPDRKLPEISRVLDGVPDDLANVIQKLSEKQPGDRYQSAQEALNDLNIDARPGKTGMTGVHEMGEQEEKPADSRRWMIIGAFAMSVVLSLAVLFMPSGNSSGSGQNENVKYGVIRTLSIDEQQLVIEDRKTGVPETFELGLKPKIYLENEQKYILLSELEIGDRVQIIETKDAANNPVYEIKASRPVSGVGELKLIDLMEEKVIVSLDKGEVRGDLPLRVPERAELTLNGEKVKLRDLRAKDRIDIRHLIPVGGEGDRVLVSLDALRTMSAHGFVTNYDVSDREMTIRYGTGNSEIRMDLELADDAKVMTWTDQSLNAEDLKVGDRISFDYDTMIRSVKVTRDVKEATGAIKALDRANKQITVTHPVGEVKQYAIDDATMITLGLSEVALDELRVFDAVEILYQEDQERNRLAATIDTSRPVSNDRWAVIIGTEGFNDRSLSPLPYGISNAQQFHQTLTTRYSFNKDRVMLVLDGAKSDIEVGLQQILGSANKQTQVIVYVVTHGYASEDGNVYLAGTDFNFDQMAQTGVSLTWLLKQLESCSSEDKILLLDATHDGKGKDMSQQPSSKTMLDKVKIPLVGTAVIGNTDDGQRGHWLERERLGVFASTLIDAYGGAADDDRDVYITADELMGYLNKAMPRKAPPGETQTPVRMGR